MRPRIKICCIQDDVEAQAAIDAGADALGLVGRGLSGPEVLEDATIARVARAVPPFVSTVLLTRQSDPAALVDQVRRTGTTHVQLCDTMSAEVWSALRAQVPNVRILQVVHVSGPASVDEARAVAPHVDAVLLDSGTPSGPNPVYGGSGRTHDWSISAEIVRALTIPVILAGGLRPDNVAEAIATVRPFGLDLCSGVRSAGRLDPAKARAFVQAAVTSSAPR